MSYNFDRFIDRGGTDATKWTKYPPDVLPLWLADMDFPVSDAVQQTLLRRCAHPIFGYTNRGEEYGTLCAGWFNERYDYRLTPDQVMLSTGVVYSVGAAIRLLTAEGDGVLVLTPSYPPLMEVITAQNRRLITCDMPLADGKYIIDFAQMQEKIDKDTKAIVLCNPHNPTGKVLDDHERRRMADFCEANGLKIISDEIHADFVYEQEFRPIMNESAYTRENTIACVSCSKTFNIAGLKVSAVFIKNPDLMRKFSQHLRLLGLHGVNTLALEAVKACYGASGDWYGQLMTYLKGNRDYFFTQLGSRFPRIKATLPASTYFFWLDFSGYGLTDPHKSLLELGKLGLKEGNSFGAPFASCARLTFAAPRPLIDEALGRLERFDREVR